MFAFGDTLHLSSGNILSLTSTTPSLLPPSIKVKNADHPSTHDIKKCLFPSVQGDNLGAYSANTVLITRIEKISGASCGIMEYSLKSRSLV